MCANDATGLRCVMTTMLMEDWGIAAMLSTSPRVPVRTVVIGSLILTQKCGRHYCAVSSTRHTGTRLRS
jgi:hypothetical protein